MDAVTYEALPRRAGAGEEPPQRSLPVLALGDLLVTAVYSLLQLWGALRFSGISAFSGVVSQDGFAASMWLSVRLALVTTVINLVLMVRPRV